MIVRTTSSQVDKPSWTAFLKKAVGACVMQDPDYLRWLEDQGNQAVLYIDTKGEKIRAAIVAIDFSLPGGLIFRSYYPLGPYSSLIALPNYSYREKTKLVDKVVSDIKWPVLALKLSDYSAVMPELNWKKADHTAFTISLTTKEKLWNNFSDSLKRYLKKYQTIIKIKAISQDQLDECYELFHKRDKKLGLSSYPVSYYQKLLALQTKGKVNWYGSYIDGKLIATAIFWIGKKDIVYADSAVDSVSFPQIYPKVEAIIWKQLQDGVKKGYKTFLLGEAIGSKNHTNFKAKWGATEDIYSVYAKETIFYSLMYSLQPIIKRFWRPY